MKLITQPNSWSCTVAAAAMVFDCTIQEIIDQIGHDGRAVVHSHLKTPGCYKGFHIQEIVDVAVIFFECSMTKIETAPVQTPDGKSEFEITKWGLFSNNEKRLEHYLSRGNGLIVGKAREYHHTVAWNYETWQIYDPQGRVYNLDDCKIDISDFWLIKSFRE